MQRNRYSRAIIPSDIDVILFDLGGVLVEFIGSIRLLQWSAGRMDADELWRRWLSSPTVRDFESGRSTPDAFARDLVREFDLPVTPEELVVEFRSWLTRPYDGAVDLLMRLAPRYRLACFSNTNELHWPVMSEEFGLEKFFERCFVSYRMGKLKPDIEAFRHVAEELGGPADRILFLDDNRINIEGAQRAGLHAYRVEGPREAAELLQRLGLLNHDR